MREGREIENGTILVVITTMLLTVIAMTFFTQAQPESPQLTVRIVDPSGNPLEKVEVSLSRGIESYRFLTNSTGYAVFSGLIEGVYTIQARIDKVIVAEATINFPVEVSKTIIASVSKITIKLTDIDGKAVPSAQIKLVSTTRLTEFNRTTSQDGKAIFNRVPYSSLSDIKGYKLTVFLEGYTILKIDKLEVDEPERELTYTLPLLSLNITTLNMEGEQISKANVKLRAGNYTKTVRTDGGVARFIHLPSSDLDWVREYTLNVTYTLGGIEYTVHTSKRMITKSQSLDLILELATLNVRVVDEDGKPLGNIKVSLSNEKSKNFTQQQTDEDGEAIFRNIPLSMGTPQAGEYFIQAFRLGRKISETRISVSSSESSVIMKIVKFNFDLILRDYNRNLLVGYDVTLVDLDSGDQYTAATGLDGRVSMKMFPGKYRIEIYKDGVVFYRDEITVHDISTTLDIEKINFPFTFKILDAFNNPIRVGEVTIRIGSQEIYEGPLNSLNILTIPYASFLTIDYKIEDALVWRETILVNGPGEHTIRVSSYVNIFGNLISLETLGVVVSLSLSAIMASIGGIAMYRSIKRKLITK